MDVLELKPNHCTPIPKDGIAREIYLPIGTIDKENPPKQVKLNGQLYTVKNADTVRHRHIPLNSKERLTGDRDRLLVSVEKVAKEKPSDDKKGSDKKDSHPAK